MIYELPDNLRRQFPDIRVLAYFGKKRSTFTLLSCCVEIMLQSSVITRHLRVFSSHSSSVFSELSKSRAKGAKPASRRSIDRIENALGHVVSRTCDKAFGFGEIGGVGQLIYNNFRFADYKLKNDKKSGLLACPVCNKKSPTDLTPKDNLSGKEILTSLCALAWRIDDVSEENDYKAFIEWCKENMHPYAIDHLYNALTDKSVVLLTRKREYVTVDVDVKSMKQE